MNKEEAILWSDKFGEAWKQQDVDLVMSLFAKEDIVYYENALGEPINNWDIVDKLWRVVPTNQKDISYWSEVLVSSDESAIIHWKVSRMLVPSGEKQEIDGIFHIKLNEHGLCKYFNQWRKVKSM